MALAAGPTISAAVLPLVQPVAQAQSAVSARTTAAVLPLVALAGTVQTAG